MNRGQLVNQEVQRISSEEVRTAMRRWKSGKAVGADDITLQVWRCFGERAVDILTRLLNTILESEHRFSRTKVMCRAGQMDKADASHHVIGKKEPYRFLFWECWRRSTIQSNRESMREIKKGVPAGLNRKGKV